MIASLRSSKMIRLLRWAAPVALALHVQAQAQNVFIEAAQPPDPATLATPVTAQAIVSAFVDGCIANEADRTKIVDWALNAGYEPLDPYAAGPRAVLGDTEGTALALPGSLGRVMLAVTVKRQCVVIADGAPGPQIQSLFKQAMGDLAAKGHTAEVTLEKTVERAGAWRQLTQLRYRRVGGTQDFGIGAVTTLNATPGTQALNMAPITPGPTRDPDGLPTR